LRKYPFAEASSARTRGTYRLCEVMKGAAADGAADLIYAKASDAEILADPRISPALRNRVLAAVMYGGAFARRVADEIAADNKLDPAIAAAILRALALKPAQAGDFQAGDASGGDLPISRSPVDDWGVGGTDRWGGGGKGPARGNVAAPSSEAGFLFPPEGKSRWALFGKVPMDRLGKPRSHYGLAR
jgi:hypothetical protein